MKCAFCGEEKEYSPCDDCMDLLREEEENFRRGICPHCKGRCEELDGSTCTTCDGKGIVN